MKTKFILLLIIFPFFISAQRLHEAKFDLFSLAYDEVAFSYEYIFKQSQSWETELRYDYGKASLLFFDTLANPSFEFKEYRRGSIAFSISRKFYFFPNPSGNKLSVALQFNNEWEIFREKQFFEDYRNHYNREINIDTWQKAALGGFIGYKFLIKDKWIVEPGFGIDADIIDLFAEDNRVLSLEGIIYLKAGYRFFGKVKQAPDTD